MIFLFAGCKKKTTIDILFEYFNCYINGKYWTSKGNPNSWNGHDKGFGAGPIGITAYGIDGHDNSGFPQTQISFMFLGNHIPANDTILLDGSPNLADVSNADSSGNSYRTYFSHTGKIIFNIRTDSLLNGFFYFDAYNPTLNKTIHITKGLFSIKLN